MLLSWDLPIVNDSIWMDIREENFLINHVKRSENLDSLYDLNIFSSNFFFFWCRALLWNERWNEWKTQKLCKREKITDGKYNGYYNNIMDMVIMLKEQTKKFWIFFLLLSYFQMKNANIWRKNLYCFSSTAVDTMSNFNCVQSYSMQKYCDNNSDFFNAQ